MIAIGLRFPSGRYHATPWGRHVNEGVPEWPPSPWRLLRAFVSVWKSKLPDLDENRVRSTLERLAAPPSFYLPPATTAHARHYMRWYKKNPTDQTLVFDAFVSVDRKSEVIVFWPETTLDEDSQVVLEKLLESMSYLGRAESWCELRLLQSPGKPANAWPINGQSPESGQELVQVLCPDPASAFDDEHVKKSTGIKRLHYNPAWHLCIETSQLHREKWSDPPGSKWVHYIRPKDCFDPPLVRKTVRHPPSFKPQILRFALDSSVLPLLTESLPVAEATRRALMSLHGKLTEQNGVRGRSEILSGRSSSGEVLRGHSHCYYLPTDEDDDGRIDHITIVAHAGFNTDEMRAVDRLSTIRTAGRDNSAHPLRVLLLAWGQLEECQPPFFGPSCEWVSATPYIATRYAKTRGRDRIDLRDSTARVHFLRKDLRRQLSEVLPNLKYCQEEILVEALPGNTVFSGQRPIQFKRFRQKGSDDGGQRLAGAFRIRFPEPVQGPIALGHSAHFGLGLFRPVDD